MVVSFITLKWGTKYGAEYVNRLYNSIKKTYSGKFNFYCMTDDSEGIDRDIIIVDLNSVIRENVNSHTYTSQKIHTFEHDFVEGNKVLLDLDVLILKDLYPYLSEYNFCEPRFINTYWRDPVDAMRTIQICSCLINSSFVTWKDDQLQYLYEFYLKNKTIIQMKYDSFDLFHFHNFYDTLKYHPKGIVYSYSFGAEYPNDLEPRKFRDNYYISIFQTSKTIGGIELHDTDDWARECWYRN